MQVTIAVSTGSVSINTDPPTAKPPKTNVGPTAATSFFLQRVEEVSVLGVGIQGTFQVSIVP